MILQAVLLGAAVLTPHDYTYGGRSLDRLRSVAAKLNLDFRDKELARVLGSADAETESMRIELRFDSITVETVRTGTWPFRVRPLVTVYPQHADFDVLKRLVQTKG